MTQTSIVTLGQSGPGSNANEKMTSYSSVLKLESYY